MTESGAKSYLADIWKAELSGYTLRRFLDDEDEAGFFFAA